MKKVGINAIGYYVPNLYVEMQDLADYRNIPYPKLNKGLGLEQMAIPDANEDAASFAANALLKLFKDTNLDPTTVGRIYLGTESALDAAKPTATYAVEAVEKELTKTYGERCFKHCDIVDLTFACIGATDALQNCLDWVRNNENRKAIVIASDVSKYQLLSTGEYTQGAGAVAFLITHNPSILTIDDVFGVATKSEGDFFKPRRTFAIKDLAEEVLNTEKISPFWKETKANIQVFKEEPVFNGQFSNQCYNDRITEALEHFNIQKETNFLLDWDQIAFHLPYSYHGRRIIFDNWLKWIKINNLYDRLINEIGNYSEENKKDWLKKASKSTLYKTFVKNKIEPSEKASSKIGNMYTASIFMAFTSLLEQAYNQDTDLTNQTIGFVAYGSGSKSKVFEGKIMSTWKENVSKLDLFNTLNNRIAINVNTYEDLHNEKIITPLCKSKKVVLTGIETKENYEGLRYYNIV